MNIFGNATPRYRGMTAQPRMQSGLLSGLLGNLRDDTVPSYRTVDGRRVSAQSSASWWSALSTSPSYKTATVFPAPAAPAQEVVLRCDVPLADNGEIDAEQSCVCAPEDATHVVILE